MVCPETGLSGFQQQPCPVALVCVKPTGDISGTTVVLKRDIVGGTGVPAFFSRFAWMP